VFTVAVVTLLLASGCTAPAVAQAPAPPAGGPALGILPPNASRVVARVIKHDVYPPGSPRTSRRPLHPARTFYSFTLEIQTAAPAREDQGSMAQSGVVVEAFSETPLPTGVVGRRVEAIVSRIGDTRSSEWLITDVQPLAD
jgi:hypothetical protein